MSQQINLLRPKDRSTGAAIASLAVVGIAVVVLVGYHQFLRMETARLQNTVGAGEQRLANVRNLIQALQKTEAAQGDASALAAEIASLRPKVDGMSQLVSDVRSGSLGTPQGFARHYDTVAGVAVEGLWVTGITVGKGGTSVAIQGRALRSEAVMQYAGRLNQVFGPHGVRFNALELSPEALAAPGAAGGPVLHTIAFKLS
jgi:MSHA biogenesis protein MshI